MTVPEPKDLSHHVSESAKRRKPNVYKFLYPFYAIPGLHDLSGGLPHSSLFPVQEIQLVTPTPSHIVGQGKSIAHKTEQKDLDVALQYGSGYGMKLMADWIKEATAKSLGDALYSGGYDTLQTMGNTDGWIKCLQVLTNEYNSCQPIETRQGLLCENFTFSSAPEAARVRGLNVVGLPIDDHGIIPAEFDALMRNWDTSHGQRPHVLYTISIGQNPTGVTVPADRRREIYALCCKYDIIIVEDEPYWFLQYDTEELVKCYLSIDSEGRVLRLDSFSKSIFPGARMGWVTGQPALIKQIFNLCEEATQAPSGPSQLILSKTLLEWGVDGWTQWLSTLRGEYKERRDIMLAAIEPYTHIGDTRVLNYKAPDGGMFVWSKVNLGAHPHASLGALMLSRALWIWCTMEPNPAIINPGFMLSCDPNPEHSAEYFRLSFAPSAKHDIAVATECIGKSLHSFWELGRDQITKLAAKFPELK